VADRARRAGRLRAYPERCQGCLACVVACSLVHEGRVDPVHARLRVIVDPLLAEHEVRVCHQCRRAPCAAACPRGAISFIHTSRVNPSQRPASGELLSMADRPLGGGSQGGASFWVVDAAACDGCGQCVAACPFQVLMLAYEGDTVRLCDTCHGAPECVASCPAGALVWEE